MFSAKDQHQASALADALHAAGFENRWRREVRKIMREMLDKNDNDWERIMPGLWRKLSRHADSTKLLRAAVEIAAETVSKEAPSFTPPSGGIIDNSEPVNVTEHTRHYPRGASVHTTTSVPKDALREGQRDDGSSRLMPTEAQREANRQNVLFMSVVPGRDIRDVYWYELPALAVQGAHQARICASLYALVANPEGKPQVRDLVSAAQILEIINGTA